MNVDDLGPQLDKGRRPSSIKTRIKTRENEVRGICYPVADHLPLKQGLRRGIYYLRTHCS